MPGLNQKEAAKLLAHIEPQGVIATPVKNGLLLRLPNGESTTVHFSGKDHRGPLNLRATLRRAGVTWPTDKTPKKITKETESKGEIVLGKMGYPLSLRSHDFKIAASLIDWNPTPTTVANFLYSKGYEGIGKTVARRYVIPDEIVIEEPKAIAIVEPEIVQERPVNLEIREFIDTHDSYAIDMELVPENISVKDMRMMIAAMGFKFEVRVWK